MVMRSKDLKVSPARIIAVKADTAVALDAAVHLVSKKGAEVLIGISPLLKTESPVYMPGHKGHILEMAFAPLIADRAIMGMVGHEPFDYTFSEGLYLGIIDRNPYALFHRSHTGHDNPAPCIFFILEFLYCALPACSHGMHGRMPAEIGHIESQREAGMEQIIVALYLVGFIIYVDSRHATSVVCVGLRFISRMISIGAPFFIDVSFKILLEQLQSAPQRFHCTRSKCAIRFAEP